MSIPIKLYLIMLSNLFPHFFHLLVSNEAIIESAANLLLAGEEEKRKKRMSVLVQGKARKFDSFHERHELKMSLAGTTPRDIEKESRMMF